MGFEPHRYHVLGEMGLSYSEGQAQPWKRGKSVLGKKPGAMDFLSGRPWDTEAVKHIKPQARASGSYTHLCSDGSINGPKSLNIWTSSDQPWPCHGLPRILSAITKASLFMGFGSPIATNKNNLLLLAFCMSRLGVPPWKGQGQGGGRLGD